MANNAIRVDTSSKFSKTIPEKVMQDSLTGYYNLEYAYATTLTYSLKGEYDQDPNAQKWEVELRQHIKSIKLDQISIGMVSTNLFNYELQNNMQSDLLLLL